MIKTAFEPVMRTPAHRLHAAAGARFGRRDGWEVPAAYGPLETERAAIRDDLAIADVSPRGKLDIRGPVDEVLARLATGRDAQPARLSASWALLLTAPGGSARLLPQAELACEPAGMATDATSIYTGIAILGPRTGELLSRLTAADLSALGKGKATALQLARIPAVLVAGERATEVYAGAEYGRYLWRTIAALTNQLGGRTVGWEALTAEGWS